MTDEKRIREIEKQIRDFRIVTSPAALDIGYELFQDKRSGDLESRVSRIEDDLRKFLVLGGGGVQVEGSFETGYTVTCPGTIVS